MKIQFKIETKKHNPKDEKYAFCEKSEISNNTEQPSLKVGIKSKSDFVPLESSSAAVLIPAPPSTPNEKLFANKELEIIIEIANAVIFFH